MTYETRMYVANVLIVCVGVLNATLINTKPICIRKWAYVTTLCGQPFWLYVTYNSGQFGIFLMACFYTLMGLRGFYNFWIASETPNV